MKDRPYYKLISIKQVSYVEEESKWGDDALSSPWLQEYPA